MPYTTDVTVRVTTDVEIEPVAEWRLAKFDDRYICEEDGTVVKCFSSHEEIDGFSLIVTPKEPAVSEPEKYTIPVEVPKEVWEEYSGGAIRSALRGEKYWYDTGGGVRTFTADDSRAFTPIVLTPRVPSYEYPAELMSPEVWGIAASDHWIWRVFTSEATLIDGGAMHPHWNGEYHVWGSIAKLFPNVQMPTPEQCHNDWRRSCFKNPNYGKGE